MRTARLPETFQFQFQLEYIQNVSEDSSECAMWTILGHLEG
jgi:hypothetical protein